MINKVATALTVYGIETAVFSTTIAVATGTLQQHLPFTVLKLINFNFVFCAVVATALTVYGIETHRWCTAYSKSSNTLQQHLPFTVLKQIYKSDDGKEYEITLQQHLPFTVLKLICLI